jgi:formylglycine-generating enzyme required for sulfatase activity
MKLGVVITIWLAGGLFARDLARIPATSQEVTDELTGVKVTVRIDEFLMSPTEVTQREWTEVMGLNPSAYKGDERPVENVSWWEAIRYANLRSVREGLEPCYDLTTGECDLTRNGYRLPTDAEWAHAAALPEKFPDDIGKFANLGNADTRDAGLLIKAIREKGTMPVASFPPNRYGLYDMTGNVWEWCGDLFNPANTPQTAANPAGASA